MLRLILREYSKKVAKELEEKLQSRKTLKHDLIPTINSTMDTDSLSSQGFA